MSYEPTNWKTGDVVTSAKLNKIEGGVSEVAEAYEPTVWKTGDVVTSTKLNKIEQALADATAESWVTVFDEEVTTEYSEQYDGNEAHITTTKPLTADTIKVTFDGTEYECQKINVPAPGIDVYAYGSTLPNEGSPDFSDYPFNISCVSNENTATVITEQAGTYSLKIEVPESSDDSGSSDFSIANVLIASQVSGTCSALIPVVEEDDGVDPARIYMQSSLTVSNKNAALEYHIPIYKGLATIEINYSEISGVNGVEVIGDIEHNGPIFFIRGDGQIKLLQPAV